MRRKQHLVRVFSIVLLLFIAGCKGSGDGSGGAPTTPFLGGSQGLEIKFLEGTPPDEVTDGDFAFQAFVSLKNKGEYDLNGNDIKVELVGILPEDFGTTRNFLEGKFLAGEVLTARQRDSEGNILESSETFVIFPDNNRNFKFEGRIGGNTPFTFKANVCYKYQTIAVSEICILENMVDVANDAICKPSESKGVFSSGSPIGITAFRQNVVGVNKIQFSFDVVHSGSGDVFDSTTAANCPTDSTRRTNKDKVKVTVNTELRTGTLNCPGLTRGSAWQRSGTVTLVNGKRTITCTQEVSDDRGDFEKSIDIKLDFNYLDSVSKQVLVKHLLSSALDYGGDTGGGTGGPGGEPGISPTIELISPNEDEWQRGDFEFQAKFIASTENRLFQCNYDMWTVERGIGIRECEGKAEHVFTKVMELATSQIEGRMKYKVTLRATNIIDGLEALTEEFFWYNIDLESPTAGIVMIKEGTPAPVIAGDVFAGENVIYYASVSDSNSRSGIAECWLLVDDNAPISMIVPDSCTTGCEVSQSKELNAGSHILRVKCNDNAGNVGEEGDHKTITAVARP